MSSNRYETQNSLQICNKYSDQIELLMSRTSKNPNRKFWKCWGCKNFQWVKDHKFSEEKIDLLVEEVRKLTLEIECLSVKFQLLHKELEYMQQCEVQRQLFDDEIWRRQTLGYDFIRTFVIVVLRFIYMFYF